MFYIFKNDSGCQFGSFSSQSDAEKAAQEFGCYVEFQNRSGGADSYTGPTFREYED